MARNQSTPLNQLPESMDTKINDNEQDQEIVNEILNEIDNQNVAENETMFNRQTDPQVNYEKETIPPPSQEEIINMNNDNYTLQPTMKEQPKKSLLAYLKNTLVVIFLVFLMSLPVFNSLLLKIPKALSNGNVTTIGNFIKAILAGLIFFIVEKFI